MIASPTLVSLTYIAGLQAGTVAKLRADGTHFMSKVFGALLEPGTLPLSPTIGMGVAATGDGILITSRIRGTVEFGSGPLVGGDTGKDYFLAKLDATGSPVWAMLLKNAQSLTLGGDPAGHAIVASPGQSIDLGTSAPLPPFNVIVAVFGP